MLPMILIDVAFAGSIYFTQIYSDDAIGRALNASTYYTIRFYLRAGMDLGASIAWTPITIFVGLMAIGIALYWLAMKSWRYVKQTIGEASELWRNRKAAPS